MNNSIKKCSSEEIIKNADRLFTSQGLNSILGFRHISWDERRVEIALQLQPMHLNGGGTIHGGTLAALLDIVCAQAGTYCPYENRMRKAHTLTLTTTFTGQCNEGEIRVIGTLRASGRKIFNSTGEVFDDQGNLLAMGKGTFRLRSGSEDIEGVDIS